MNPEDTNKIDMTSFGIVHFGSATAFLPGPLQSTYKNILQKANENGLFISFDPNYRNLLFADNKPSFIQQSWDFILQCNFFKVSDEEAMLLTDKQSVEDAAAVFFSRSNAVFAITIGKEGTLLGFEKQIALIPSIEIEPVDTTGAGDAFVGAILFQLSKMSQQKMNELNKEKWSHLFANANKAGARTCEYMGAMEAFKHLSVSIIE